MPLFTFDSLADNIPKNPPSLIGSGLLPEHGLMLVVAKTGVGKSVIVSDVGLSLVLQQPLFNAFKKHNDKNGDIAYFPVHQACKVLYFDTEVGQAGLHMRNRALKELRCNGFSVEKQFEFITEHPESLMLFARDVRDTGFKTLRSIIGDSKPNGLRYVVVFDPLGDFHEIDENESAMRLVMQRIQTLQREFGFAAIITHHESDRPQQSQWGPVDRKGTAKSRGHSSITQKMDTVVTLDSVGETVAGVASLRIEWPKVRHGCNPVPGMLLVDYRRMMVEWTGPCKGNGIVNHNTRRSDYLKSPFVNLEE